jgi:hypothetical protein
MMNPVLLFETCPAFYSNNIRHLLNRAKTKAAGTIYCNGIGGFFPDS